MPSARQAGLATYGQHGEAGAQPLLLLRRPPSHALLVVHGVGRWPTSAILLVTAYQLHAGPNSSGHLLVFPRISKGKKIDLRSGREDCPPFCRSATKLPEGVLCGR